MNTTAAARTAGVTPGTVATWCRTGVITAVKQAGRWVIEQASLTHRIALGALKTRKQQTVTAQAATGKAFLAIIGEELRLTIKADGETILTTTFAYPDTETDVWHVMGGQPDEPFDAADRVLAQHGWQRSAGRRWIVGDIVYGTQATIERI